MLLPLLMPLLLPHALVVSYCCVDVANVQSLIVSDANYSNNSNNSNNNNNDSNTIITNNCTYLKTHECQTKLKNSLENTTGADVATDDVVAGNAAPVIAAAASDSNAKIVHRGKRYLDFTRGTRVSWRTNIKNNLIKVNTLWAHAFGFRFNYPFPDKADRLRPFYKRDVLTVLEESISAHGFDGRACVLKSYCSTILDTNDQQTGGILFGLLRILFSLDNHDRHHLPHLRPSNCEQILHTHCPLSFNNISPFTDDV